MLKEPLFMLRRTGGQRLDGNRTAGVAGGFVSGVYAVHAGQADGVTWIVLNSEMGCKKEEAADAASEINVII